MKILRTAKDICLLCQLNPADKTGSHFTPAGIIKRVIGERDYEEIYTISAHSATTSTYFGRSNLLNTDPDIKKPEHTADYVFCSSCEKKLGAIESECNHTLIVLTDKLSAGSLNIERTSKGNKFFKFNNPGKKTLALFFYSIIWRQCLLHSLESGNNIISAPFEDELRQLIFNNINKSKKDIEESYEFENYPKLILLTTYHKGDNTNNFINPNTSASNPELFFIGPYNALILHSPKLFTNFEVKTGLPLSIIDKELSINLSPESIIAVINEAAWKKVTTTLIKRESEKFLHTMTSALSNKKRMPYFYCRQRLHVAAHQFLNQYPDDYIRCLHIAFQLLMR
ncbi:hypothetical protein BH11BAC5_BH11BAC5_12480 [soil metagenome]